MRPSGLAEVAAAQADGRWAAAYESQRNATVPLDLATALAGNPAAQHASIRKNAGSSVRSPERGGCFVSSESGNAANEVDAIW